MTDAALTLQGPAAERVRGAFEDEEIRGLRLAMKVRFIALAVIAVWLMIQNFNVATLFYLAFLPLFGVIGAAPLALRRAGANQPWVRYAFPLLDVALMTFMLFTPNPWEVHWLPVGMKLRFGTEIYYYVLLAAAMLTYSPRVVLATGLAAALGWALGALWVLDQPGTYVAGYLAMEALASDGEKIALLTDPNRVDLGRVGAHMVVVLIVAGTLAGIVWRTRQLVLSQAMAERERGNLARYFSPNMVDALATTDEPWGQVRNQEVAVLFVDIVGFTSLSEGERPERVIGLLRDFHGRMAQAVFAHGGTLDKYLGDGLMVTFGTPWPGPKDAANALGCARAMTTAMALWNAERAADGRVPVRIGVGIHHGAVVLGDIGGESRLEYAVIGDAVNVASRLEHLTRELGVEVVASANVVAALGREERAEALAGFREGATQSVRGREGRLGIWTLAAAEG
jgi:adenylate cyclase